MLVNRIIQLARFEPVMSREPCHQCRCPLDHPQLPQRNANGGARKPVGSHPAGRRHPPRDNGLHNAPLDVGEFRVAVAGQERLESRVALRLEG